MPSIKAKNLLTKRERLTISKTTVEIVKKIASRELFRNLYNGYYGENDCISDEDSNILAEHPGYVNKVRCCVIDDAEGDKIFSHEPCLQSATLCYNIVF